jgi:preprotein translocase subunit SecD
MLSDTVVLDMSGIDSVRLDVGPHGRAVSLRASLVAADRFLSTTTGHTGTRLGILLNGQLLQAPEIAGPWAGYIPVAHALDSALAGQLRDRLRAAVRQRPSSRPG